MKTIKFAVFAFAALLLTAGCVTKPSYYGFEDLRNGLKDQSFYFANSSKPTNARVDLGFIPIYPASGQKRMSVCYTIWPNPSRFRVKSSRAFVQWSDSSAYNFDWPRFTRESGQRGDLIFIRANGKCHDLVKIFSSWTHVAIADDPFRSYVFEAMLDGGVRSNYTPDKWGALSYYSCKKITVMSRGQIESALNQAKSRLTGLPYLPNVKTTADMLTFLARWSDKNNLESMYCSKLVYNTFKSYVNLDTNNTSVFWDSLCDKRPGVPAFSWIGVSPDDIYYSEALGPDFCYSSNLSRL
ncbi:MAG: YiiX/YebB-like N1pC/P60 family cysteine hydrolase [Candidatus Margulisiibacteriota bacterium]